MYVKYSILDLIFQAVPARGVWVTSRAAVSIQEAGATGGLATLTRYIKFSKLNIHIYILVFMAIQKLD